MISPSKKFKTVLRVRKIEKGKPSRIDGDDIEEEMEIISNYMEQVRPAYETRKRREEKRRNERNNHR